MSHAWVMTIWSFRHLARPVERISKKLALIGSKFRAIQLGPFIRICLLKKNGFTIQKQREKLLVHENRDLEEPKYYSYSSPH